MGGARDAGQLRKVEERYKGYDVYDIDQDKIGSVERRTWTRVVKGSTSPLAGGSRH